MKLFIFVVILLLSANFSFAQKSPKSEYIVRFKNRQVSVRHQHKTHRLNLGDAVDAAKITEAEILFADRKNDFTYLVLAITGQSKEESDDRQCGAGIEANLIWVKLDAVWKVVGVDSARYESCWSGIMSDDGYKIDGKLLTIEFENFRDDVSVKLSYNAAQPEAGFQIEKKPLKEIK